MSELVSLETLQKKKLNIIKSPTGSGKTYFALRAIPESISDAYHHVVYLIDTVNGKEQILQNYNATVYSSYWKEEVSHDELQKIASQKLVVMTYAKLGQLLLTDKRFCHHFDYIICDELPSLLKFQNFSEKPNLHSIAKEALEEVTAHSDTVVIALTATPDLLYRQFKAPYYEVPIEQTLIRRYKTGEIVGYDNLECLLSSLEPDETGICYVSHITQMKSLEEKARELGFNPISIWSINNKDHPMNEEQLAARQSILKDFTLPPQYNLLFINASSETSLKIKSPVDYVIVHSKDCDTQVQVRGRVNRDLSKLYLPHLDPTALTVPNEYLNKPLFAAEKNQLCEILNRKNPYNRPYRWPSIKSMLIDCDYTLSEGRKDNRRYVIITPPQ